MKVYPKNNVIVLLVLSILASTIISCARPGTISGGPRDETPPKIREEKSSKNYSTSFSEKEIVLEFDEWVRLNNPKGNIIISPYLEDLPSYRLKGKKLIIDLSSTELRDSTTYIFNISNAVEDITEGNQLEAQEFVLSTGSFIDSLELQGEVLDYITKDPLEKTDVCLYDRDSVLEFLQTRNPIYTTKTNESGQFHFKNLSKGNYSLVAIRNSNSTIYYDEDDELVSLPLNLELESDNNGYVKIDVFDEENSLRIEDFECNSNTCFITFNRPFDLKEVSIVPSQNKLLDQYKEVLDVYSLEALEPFKIIIGEDSTDIRSFKGLKNLLLEVSTINNEKISNSIEINSNDSLEYRFNKIIESIDSVLLFSQKDSSKVPLEYQLDNNKITIRPTLNESENYQIRIVNARSKSDSTSIQTNVSIVDNSQVGDLELIIPLEYKGYLFKVLKLRDQKPISSGVVNDRVFLKKKLPGKYVMELVNDINGDGKWTKGILKENLLPEQKILSDTFSIRSNWTIIDTLIVN